MNSRLIPAVKNAALILVLLLSPSLPGSLAAADKLPPGQPFQILADRVSQVEQKVAEVQAVLPPLAVELAALANLTPPDELIVSASEPCPEGYVLSASQGGLPPGFTLCVRGEIPGLPPPPKVCQEGYALNESLSIGALLVCEQITGGAATVYVTHPAVTAQGMTLTAQCPESFVVTGGGYASEDIGRFFQDVLVYASKPLPPDRWMVAGEAVNGTTRPLSVYAMCINPDF